MSENPFVKPTRPDPFSKPVTNVELVRPAVTSDGKVGVVVLDKIEPGITPDYCVHGRCSCISCNDWCWLGSETHEAVRSGQYVGLCLECANEKLPPTGLGPDRRLRDH